MTEKTEFENAISEANIDMINALWAILKYQEYGILKKARAMCCVLRVNVDDFVDLLPKNKDGRILDKDSRHFIHDILIRYSNYNFSQS